MIAVLELVVGLVLLGVTWLSVLRTVITPRQRTSRMMRFWTGVVSRSCIAVGRRLPKRPRERVLDMCTPLSLLATGMCWGLAAVAGIALLAPVLAGSSFWSAATARFLLLRLDSPAELVAVAGWLSVLAVLSVFLLHLARVTSAYSRRELGAARVFMPAYPPSEAEFFLTGHLRSVSWDHVDGVFVAWAQWLADIEATHTGYPALTYYRPAAGRCWLDAAVLVLDAAALTEAVAPAWAPPGVRAVLEAGTSCLPTLCRQVGIDLVRPPVSLEGREERGFEHSMRIAVRAGLPRQRDYPDAWLAFQRRRTRYAPYAAAIRARLLYPEDERDPNGDLDEEDDLTSPADLHTA